jgi:hypothetical protein
MIYSLPSRARSGGFPLIRELVGSGRYKLTEKAYELHSQGCFELEDLENSILCGAVVKTECDELNDSVGNKKYTIIGPDIAGYDFYSVGKIQRLEGSRLYPQRSPKSGHVGSAENRP